MQKMLIIELAGLLADIYSWNTSFTVVVPLDRVTSTYGATVCSRYVNSYYSMLEMKNNQN